MVQGKVAVVADSIACLPREMQQYYGVRVVPINISYEGRLYHDGIDLSPAEAYRMLRANPDQFFSSPPSVGEYQAILQKTLESTHQILCITLSSKLSGMNNVARLAASQLLEKSPQAVIRVMDSLTAATGEGLLVRAVSEAAYSGKNMDEICLMAEKIRSKISLFGVMDTIRHVYRTGRIPRLAARFGSALNIRPIFSVSEGMVRVIGITGKQENGIKHVLSMMKANIGRKPVHIAVCHAEIIESAQKLVERIKSEFDCREIWLTDFSPVMAYATGAGVLAIGYYTDD